MPILSFFGALRFRGSLRLVPSFSSNPEMTLRIGSISLTFLLMIPILSREFA